MTKCVQVRARDRVEVRALGQGCCSQTRPGIFCEYQSNPPKGDGKSRRSQKEGDYIGSGDISCNRLKDFNQNDVRYLGREDNVPAKENLASAAKLAAIQRTSSHRSQCCPICYSYWSQSASHVRVQQNDFCNHGQAGDEKQGFGNLKSSIAISRSSHSLISGSPSFEGGSSILVPKFVSTRQCNCVLPHCLEDNVQVGGGFPSSSMEFRSDKLCGSGNRLVRSAKGEAEQSVHSFPLCCDCRGPDSYDCFETFENQEFQRLPVQNECFGNLASMEGIRSDCRVVGALPEERCHESPNKCYGTGGESGRGLSRQIGKTQDGRRTEGHHHQILFGQAFNGSSSGHPASHSVSLNWFDPHDKIKEFSKEDASFGFHSKTKRGKKTAIPRTQEEMNAPLHVAKVRSMDVQFILGRMAPERQKRFMYVWNLTFFPSVQGDVPVVNARKYRRDHADELVLNGVAESTSSIGSLVNIPFNVIEHKSTGIRQRFILWTKQANLLLKRINYIADVPLSHVSKYLSIVEAECSSGRDFRTGFYQLEIPVEARKYFAFECEDGSFFQLCRLPMAATFAGIHGYTRDDLIMPNVRSYAWIDNILICGNKVEVQRATETLDMIANLSNATWKLADSYTCLEKQTFTGIDFDHSDKSISPSKRLIEKISSFDPGSASIADVESQLGRLLHAAAIAGVPVGKFWFALKFSNRLTNQVNRGLKKVGDPAEIPVSVIRSFNS
eukprot:TRINITY_DN263_c0_g1_i11.p1 TRINITY_DN263_c0_g1~~TRINITY_DN263_c0_g1_i11.p1  ORF type:complete len:725 (-),score=39.78 TRINITY_DN263_c0_g1_i11:415-2589(-)